MDDSGEDRGDLDEIKQLSQSAVVGGVVRLVEVDVLEEEFLSCRLVESEKMRVKFLSDGMENGRADSP